MVGKAALRALPEADRTAPSVHAPEGPATPQRGRSLSLWVATAAAVTPVLVAAVRGVARGWVPTGDAGYLAIRARDVLSGHPPLTGASSHSVPVSREIYHPGPLNYDLLALPVRLLGRGWGMALGIAVLNVLAIVGIAWLLRRRVGATSATVGVGLVALLVWSMGSEVLYDPWHTHATLLPFALFLVAVWSVVAGDPAGLVPMVVAGSYVAQYHLSFVIPVVGLVVLAAVISAVRALRMRRDPEAWPRRRARILRWAALTGVVALVCWLQPLYQQVFGEGDGNLWALYDVSGERLPHPSIDEVVRVYGATVALPPWWLPGSFRSPSFDPDGTGPPLVLAAAALVALLAGLAVAGWRAWRRGNVDVAAGAVTALAGLAAGAVALWKAPTTLGIITYQVRFMWPLAMVVGIVVAVAVLDELASRRRRFSSSGRRFVGVSLVGAAVAVVAGASALPTRDNGALSYRWAADAANALGPQVVAAVDSTGPVLVELPIDLPTIEVGPAVLGELQEAGIDFVTNERIIARQAGFHREAQPGEAQVRLTFRGGVVRDAPGQRLVASWSSLSADEQAELDRLTADLAAAIRRDGVSLRPGAGEVLDALNLGAQRDLLAEAQADPERLLAGGDLWSVVRGWPATYAGGSLVDDSSYPAGLLVRWSELAERRDTQTIAVYVSPAA